MQATVTVETALNGPSTFTVDSDAPPSAFVKWLQPDVSVKLGDTVVYEYKPYGSPAERRSSVQMFVVLAALLVVLALW